MKHTIYFVTGNSVKFAEAKAYIEKYAPTIDLQQLKVDLPEIQSLDLQEVATKKAQAAWYQVKAPMIIDDAGLFLDVYPLFPGTMTKFIVKAIGVGGVLKIAQGEGNTNVTFRGCVVYKDDESGEHAFVGETRAEIRDPSDPINPEAAFDALMYPHGYDESFKQLRTKPEFESLHYRFRALKKFVDWYQSNL